jgi:hypothetical protein
MSKRIKLKKFFSNNVGYGFISFIDLKHKENCRQVYLSNFCLANIVFFEEKKNLFLELSFFSNGIIGSVASFELQGSFKGKFELYNMEGSLRITVPAESYKTHYKPLMNSYLEDAT